MLISWDIDFLEFCLFAPPLNQQGSQGTAPKARNDSFGSSSLKQYTETSCDTETHVEVDQRLPGVPWDGQAKAWRRHPEINSPGRCIEGGQQMLFFGAASTNQRARIHRGTFEDHEQSTSQGQPWRWLSGRGNQERNCIHAVP